MNGYFLKHWLSISVIILSLDNHGGAGEEYCNGEQFKARCTENELVLMESAFYGRMHTGECMPNHLDYMGCKSDVLAHFDARCSAKQSCDVLVTDRDIPTGNECTRGYMRFLEASYSCKSALSPSSMHCSHGKSPDVELKTSQVYISRDVIRNSCIHANRTWTLSASKGQHLNISLVSFDSNKQHKNVIYGSITDPKTYSRVTFGSGQRFRHLVVSEGHSLEVVIHTSDKDKSNYLLFVKVLGCADLLPPEGSWVSRDGDVMQIGCHSGDKAWSLRCINNQWVGAVGQCGTVVSAVVTSEGTQSDTDVSINVLVFGVCCLVVLVSAMAFLVGVCFLRRRNPEPIYMLPPEQDGLTLSPQRMIPTPPFSNPPDVCTCDVTHDLPELHSNTLPTMHKAKEEPEYNSIRVSYPAYATYDLGLRGSRSTLSRKTVDYSQYMKNASEKSESVKYFVLEATN